LLDSLEKLPHHFPSTPKTCTPKLFEVWKEGVGIIWASSRRGPESVCVGGQVIGVDRKVGLGVWDRPHVHISYVFNKLVVRLLEVVFIVC
jgi:hypothetical protein